MTNWPTQAGVRAFYGEPGNPQCTAGKCIFPVPMRIDWDRGKTVTKASCHAKCADAFTRIFADTVKHYGEEEFRRLGLDLFGGCYNLRKMRGGSSYSMHSWGIAMDLDPGRNQLKWGRDKAEFAKPAYDAFWQIVEEAGAVSLGRHANYDWMHFQFARL